MPLRIWLSDYMAKLEVNYSALVTTGLRVLEYKLVAILFEEVVNEVSLFIKLATFKSVEGKNGTLDSFCLRLLEEYHFQGMTKGGNMSQESSTLRGATGGCKDSQYPVCCKTSDRSGDIALS